MSELPPLLLYIVLHNVSDTTCCWHAVWPCIVTMEKDLTNITDKMCAKTLSKIYDLTDKFTCQCVTQAVYLLTAMYYKINSQKCQFQSNYHSYSQFSMWEVKNKGVTSIHGKPITIFVR